VSVLERQFAAAWVVRCPDLPFVQQFALPAWVDWAQERKAAGLIKRARPMAADFAWPDARVAVEIQGGTWVKGGHSTGAGIRRDVTKSNLAQLSGWACLALTADMIEPSWLARLEQLVRSRL
jgi:hypothetical protein